MLPSLVTLPHAVQVKVTQVVADLAAGRIPVGFKRINDLPHMAVVGLGWSYRALVDIRTRPWHVTDVLTHSQYNTIMNKLRKRRK